jgi:hypothetical protein
VAQGGHTDQDAEGGDAELVVAGVVVDGVDDQPRDDDVDEMIDDRVELGAEAVGGPGQPGRK